MYVSSWVGRINRVVESGKKKVASGVSFECQFKKMLWLTSVTDRASSFLKPIQERGRNNDHLDTPLPPNDPKGEEPPTPTQARGPDTSSLPSNLKCSNGPVQS